MWRSLQQSQAAQEALDEIKTEGGTATAFSRLTIGANPLSKLNTMRQRGQILKGPDMEVNIRPGSFLVKLCVKLASGKEVDATGEGKKKQDAKNRAATALLERMGLSEDV